MLAVYVPHSWFSHKAKKQFFDQIWCFLQLKQDSDNIFHSVVKTMFGWVLQIYFKLQVIYKSCRQVLTSSNNSQLLLKLDILDKLRLVTKTTVQRQRKLQHFLVCSGMQETGDSTTLNHCVSEQQHTRCFACTSIFTWQCQASALHPDRVKCCCYHNS